MATKRITPKGSDEENKLWTEVMDHYVMAQEDLDTRIQRRNGFNDADKMFASHIDEKNWPYSSIMFDPRPWTVILEKSARLVGSKPRGKLVPREDGDTLGATINNELLNFQWDDNGRLGESMLAKWMQMDQNTRKYGSSFAIAKWRWQKDKKNKTFYNGPDFQVCNPRDVLANPSYSYINKWFQYREWLTIDDMEKTNDVAISKPVYKNLDKLRMSLKEMSKGKGDNRSTSYTNKNKEMRGLTEYLGRDEVFKVLEIVTEYRNDKWITFSPRHGVIVRETENPYSHGEIPVVHLKYYSTSDDLYGISEFEPVSKLIKAINAHMSAYNDRVALRLRPPLHVNPIEVRMHTLEWAPEAKWLMEKPNQSVQVMQTNSGEDSHFQAVYSVLVSSLLNAWGETSQGVSNLDPFQGDKTATEVRDSAFTRNVRDNANQLMLAEAIKKQMMYWYSMNQQLLFEGDSQKLRVIRIVGKEAVEYFKKMGMHEYSPTSEEAMGVITGQETGFLPGPKFGVTVDDENTVPKFQPDEFGSGGELIIEPGDLNGNYDYIADIETMQAPSSQDTERKLTSILGVLTNPTVIQLLANEQKRPKVTELLVKMFESTRVIKDAEAYFEDVKEQQPISGGETPAAGGVPAQGVGGDAGIPPVQQMAGIQNTQRMGGSSPV